MYDRRSTGHRQAGGAGPPHQVGEVLPTTQSNLLLLRFYLGHKQDALSTPGGEIEQHQGFRKDDTIEGTGDSKVATKNAGMCHSYETSCTIGTRQIQRHPEDGVGSLQGREVRQQDSSLDSMGQKRYHMVGKPQRVHHVPEKRPGLGIRTVSYRRNGLRHRIHIQGSRDVRGLGLQQSQANHRPQGMDGVLKNHPPKPRVLEGLNHLLARGQPEREASLAQQVELQHT